VPSTGESMTAIPDRLAAALADRYRIERELGQGGMATVYLAHDLRHDRRVAIKVLRPELAAVIGAERFLSEIRTTANLQHPHILPLHDSGEADSFLYYVMPYVEGESLRNRLTREKQLAVAEAIRIASEVAGALDYAHRHGIVHRDIKPENILLHDDRALIADFGIALAATSAGTRMTETGMSLGTPHYMSPEQAMGDRELDARSDVYALACVTYELLMGEPPFTGPTAQAIIAKVMTDEPPSLTGHRKTVPPHVEAAVLQGLQKLPADRFSSAAEFARALSDTGFTRTIASAAAGRGTAGRQAIVPRSWFNALLGLSALLLVTTAVAWFRPGIERPTSRQRVAMWRSAMSSLLDPGAERVGTQATIAPDGSSIVYADSSAGAFRLFRKLRGEAVGSPIPGTEGALTPFFSPDGRWVGYLTLDRQVRKVPLEGGGSVALADDADVTLSSGAWLEGGMIVYGSRAGITMIPEDGGPGETLLRDTVDLMRPITMAPLPGTSGFLFTSCLGGNCANGSSVYAFDLRTSEAKMLVPDAAGVWYAPTGHLLYIARAGGLFAVGFDVRRLELTSGAVPVLENVLPGSLALSPSGTILYSVGTGGRIPAELMWVARDGRAVPLDSTWRADFHYPALSPDGRALAVSLSEATTQIWIRRDDGTRQKLTLEGTVNWRPSWTPDGGAVLFASNRLQAGEVLDLMLFESPVDGSGTARLVVDHDFSVWEGEYSPDGRWVVFRSDEIVGERGSDSNIRGLRLAGDTSIVPLVTDSATQTQLAISPNGRWLAWTGNPTGQREIYIAPFPDMSYTRVVSLDGGTEPRWAPNGRELFYKSGGHLMAVDVTASGSGLQFGSPRPLFSIREYRSARNRPEYDVAPDGQHFLMIRDVRGEGGAEVFYVENWFEELKAKVGR